MFSMLSTDGAVSRYQLRDGFARFATLRQSPGLIDAAENVAEVEAKADELFDAIRRGAADFLTKAELVAHLAGSAYTELAIGNIFDAIDADANGQISREELRGSCTRISA